MRCGDKVSSCWRITIGNWDIQMSIMVGSRPTTMKWTPILVPRIQHVFSGFQNFILYCSHVLEVATYDWFSLNSVQTFLSEKACSLASKMGGGSSKFSKVFAHGVLEEYCWRRFPIILVEQTLTKMSSPIYGFLAHLVQYSCHLNNFLACNSMLLT